MSAVFLKILNLSITASWLILAVFLVRLLLKKAPKWISCALWVLVAVRLICPFSPESALSVIPSGETVPGNIETMNRPTIDSGITAINSVVNPMIAQGFAPNPTAGVNPLQIVIRIMSVVWITGMIALMINAFISYIRLKKSVGASVPVKDNILLCDEVMAPLILGIIKPLIYVPSSMNGEILDCVISHEKAHIRRRDYLWKPLGYLLLTVYWFNPLCWIAYILLCRDIETACDESVIRELDSNGKAAYSQALLNCSFSRKRITCPVAFGEIGVKGRIKSVLSYKKPGLWLIILSVIVCLVTAVCFLTNPKTKTVPLPDGLFVYREDGLLPDVSISVEDKTIRVSQSFYMSYAEIFTYKETKDGIEIFDADGNLTEHTIKAGRDCVIFDGKKYVRYNGEEQTETFIPAETSFNVIFDNIDFKARYIRTYGAYENYGDDSSRWFMSAKELKDYCEENKDRFELVKIPEFQNAVREYDDNFFREHDLILCVITAGSGSMKFEVTSLKRLPTMYDRIMYTLEPQIRCTAPEAMTQDIAHWHIFIEIEKGYGENSELCLPNVYR